MLSEQTTANSAGLAPRFPWLCRSCARMGWGYSAGNYGGYAVGSQIGGASYPNAMALLRFTFGILNVTPVNHGRILSSGAVQMPRLLSKDGRRQTTFPPF